MLGRRPAGPTGMLAAADPASSPRTPAPMRSVRERGSTERQAWAILVAVSRSRAGRVRRAAATIRDGARDPRAGAAARRGAAACRPAGVTDDRETFDACGGRRRSSRSPMSQDAVLERVELPGVDVADDRGSGLPARLLAIELPPHVLFVRGDPAALSAVHAVAVVGTRRPSEAGRGIGSRIGGALATAGAVGRLRSRRRDRRGGHAAAMAAGSRPSPSSARATVGSTRERTRRSPTRSSPTAVPSSRSSSRTRTRARAPSRAGTA